MDSAMVFIISVLVLSIVFLFLSFLRKQRKDILPYEKLDSILTNNELKFYKVLKPIVDKNDYILLIKPRLADIIQVKKGTEKWQGWFNKIKSKHVDFLLCAREDLSPILGIELDDKSHERKDRQERDEFVDALFAKVDLPILHVNRYDKQTLERAIIEFLN